MREWAEQVKSAGERALAQVRQAGSPYLRMIISRSGTNKVDVTTEIVP